MDEKAVRWHRTGARTPRVVHSPTQQTYCEFQNVSRVERGPGGENASIR